MSEEHIEINAQNFVSRNLRFLIDSGAEMNIIKLSARFSGILLRV